MGNGVEGADGHDAIQSVKAPGVWLLVSVLAATIGNSSIGASWIMSCVALSNANEEAACATSQHSINHFIVE